MKNETKKKNIWDFISFKINDFGKIEVFFFILYILLAIIISLNHEFSPDEAQSFLISRDLNPFEILIQMKYEGHSFLWYYLILPFAKIGVIEFQKVVPLLFSIVAVYIILEKAPFNLVTKLLLIFNPVTLYYNLFARPYCMILFFLVCIAVLYKDKKLHPYKYALCIGLLSHTHLIMLPTCFFLVVFFWGKEWIVNHRKNTKEENRKLCGSFLLVLFLMLIVVIIVILGYINCKILDYIVLNRNNSSMHIFETWLMQVAHLFGTNNNWAITLDYLDYFPFTFFVILMMFVLILCLFGIKSNIKQGIVFWVQYLFVLFVHYYFWFPLPSRSFIVIYTLMFWVWTYLVDNQMFVKVRKNLFLEVAFILLLIISIPRNYILVYQDLTKNCHSGKVTAQFIENNIPKNSIFINISHDYSQLLAGYLKENEYKIYMANTKRYSTYTRWDEKYLQGLDKDEIKKTILDIHKKNNGSEIYVLEPFTYNLSQAKIRINEIYNSSDFELEFIYGSNRDIMIDDMRVYDNVNYKIYKIKFK